MRMLDQRLGDYRRNTNRSCNIEHLTPDIRLCLLLVTAALWSAGQAVLYSYLVQFEAPNKDLRKGTLVDHEKQRRRIYEEKEDQVSCFTSVSATALFLPAFAPKCRIRTHAHINAPPAGSPTCISCLGKAVLFILYAYSSFACFFCRFFFQACDSRASSGVCVSRCWLFIVRGIPRPPAL